VNVVRRLLKNAAQNMAKRIRGSPLSQEPRPTAARVGADVELDENLSQCLAQLSQHGAPAQLEFGVPSAANWGRHSMTGSVTSVTVDRGALQLEVAGAPVSDVWSAREVLKSDQPPLSVTWDDGTEATAGRGLMRSVTFGESSRLILEGHEARAARGGALPRYWVGRLNVSWRELQGNLVIHGQSGTRIVANQGNLRLDGAYEYYLVAVPNSTEPHHVLVVDLGGSRWPDRGSLGSDFAAMEFVLGQPLMLTDLVGVDATGRPIAWMGLKFEQHRAESKRLRAPTPTGQFREPYIAELFRLVSAHQQRTPERLIVALAYYVESLFEPHLDGAYLKLQVALEATAKHLVGQKSGAVTIVKDRRAWSRWVKSIAPTVRQLAAVGQEETVLGKIRNAAFIPSGHRVEVAFREFGLELPDELKAEVALRNVVAHAALMSTPGKRDVSRDVSRVGKVQTLLAALVALAVGYRGRLVGWERNRLGAYEDAPPSLWKVGEATANRYWARYTLPAEPG
jgi:hypothetical protein